MSRVGKTTVVNDDAKGDKKLRRVLKAVQKIHGRKAVMSDYAICRDPSGEYKVTITLYLQPKESDG